MTRLLVWQCLEEGAFWTEPAPFFNDYAESYEIILYAGSEALKHAPYWLRTFSRSGL